MFLPPHGQLGLHRTSYPALAEIRPHFHIWNEAGFDHILIHMPHCQFVYEFNFFTNHVGLQLKTSHPRPQPDWQFQIRPRKQ